MSREQLESGKKYALILVTSILILSSLGLLGFLTMYYWEESANREPAQLADQEMIPPMEINKMRIPISISLSSEPIPENEDQPIKIEAKIRANQEIAEVINYRWTLPSEVSPTGLYSVEGTISAPSLGETLSVPIEVTGFTSSQPLQISFQAYYVSAGQKIGNSALISSKKSESLEYKAHTKMKALIKFQNKLHNE